MLDKYETIIPNTTRKFNSEFSPETIVVGKQAFPIGFRYLFRGELLFFGDVDLNLGGSIFGPFGGEWSRNNLPIKPLNIAIFCWKDSSVFVVPGYSCSDVFLYKTCQNLVVPFINMQC